MILAVLRKLAASWVIIATLMAKLNLLLRPRAADGKQRVQSMGPRGPDAWPIGRMDYTKYSPSPNRYRVWIDILFDKTNIPYPVPAVLFACVPFVIGLVTAWRWGFIAEYVRALPFYLGSLGIFWTSAMIRYASTTIHSVFEKMRPCFLVPDGSYRRLLETAFGRVVDQRANAKWFSALVLLALLATVTSFWFPDAARDVGLGNLRPSLFFPDADAPLVGTREVRAVIVFVFGVFIAGVVGQVFHGVVCLAYLIVQCAALPVLPYPEAIRHRMAGLTTFAVVLSVSYFLGVALVAVFFSDAYDDVSVLGLIAISLIGVFIFAVPQVVYMRLTARSRELRMRIRLSLTLGALGVELVERPVEVPEGVLEALRAGYAESLQLAESDDAKPLVYSPADFIWVLIGQGSAIGGFFLEGGLTAIMR